MTVANEDEQPTPFGETSAVSEFVKATLPAVAARFVGLAGVASGVGNGAPVAPPASCTNQYLPGPSRQVPVGQTRLTAHAVPETPPTVVAAERVAELTGRQIELDTLKTTDHVVAELDEHEAAVRAR